MTHRGKGLPYGWWRSAAFADAVMLTGVLIAGTLLFVAWWAS